MNKGTIILTRFPFTDFSKTELRPAIIVSSQKKQGTDVIVAFISSQVNYPALPTEYIIDIINPDFKETGLKKKSVFKMDKLVTIEKKLILGEIGKVSDSILIELNKRLRITFDI